METLQTVTIIPEVGAPMYSPSKGVSKDIQTWFNSVDKDHSGFITWEELKRALVNAQGNYFNDNTCKILISMFDPNKVGKVDVYGFGNLFNYVQKWVECFKIYDTDKTGHIEKPELKIAFQQMGFKFTDDFINFLVVKADKPGNQRISVDQFILICIQIQRLTEEFRNRDTTRTGVINIKFEDLLALALSLSP